MINQSRKSSQSGLTLIELMISVTLGLLLSAAASQLFATGVSVYRVQATVSNFQETVAFGLDYMEKKVAVAGYGTESAMTAKSGGTGLVLTGSDAEKDTSGAATGFQVGNLKGAKLSGLDFVLSAEGVGKSNVADGTKSDRLVIQYQVPQAMTDCEGNKVETVAYSQDVEKLEDSNVVIERYYVKEDPDSGDLAMYCDASQYIKPKDMKNMTADQYDITGITSPTDLPDLEKSGGVMIMKPIDYFRVLVAVKTGSGTTYMSINEYKKDHADKVILGVQMGIIARSKTQSAVNNGDATFELLDKKTLKLKASTPGSKNQYLRRGYTTTINFRNGRG